MGEKRKMPVRPFPLQLDGSPMATGNPILVIHDLRCSEPSALRVFQSMTRFDSLKVW